ncbi:hypothetical protein M0R72_12130 [Candidatus Pacearchaeota archaeon]|jgi:hypothetical protein|nr:hypothetical protein [Candidatus Pacearchaeota archaeon]
MADTILSDSYIETDAELETLIGSDPRAGAVALKALAATSQAWYCQEATRHIDALSLRGTKYDQSFEGIIPAQALEFPRIIDGKLVGDAYGNDVVPAQVKRACLEEAIAIMEWGASWRRKNQEQGVTQVQLGSGSGLSESYLAPTTMLSFRARQIMRRYMGANIR